MGDDLLTDHKKAVEEFLAGKCRKFVTCLACGGEGIEHRIVGGIYTANTCRSCRGSRKVEVQP